MGTRSGFGLADSWRGPFPAQAAGSRRSARGLGRGNVPARPDDARRSVPASDRRPAHHRHLLRRILRQPDVGNSLPVHGLARLCAAGHRRSRPRLRDQIPGGGRFAEPAGDGGRLRNCDGEKRLMPKMNLSHFEASLLFALLTSVVLGIITKRTDRERVRYAMYCFACFMGAIFGLSWLMYLGHG